MSTPSRRGMYACLYYPWGLLTAWRSTAASCGGVAGGGPPPRRGPPLELYRVDAHDTNREEEYVTELQMRVE